MIADHKKFMCLQILHALDRDAEELIQASQPSRYSRVHAGMSCRIDAVAASRCEIMNEFDSMGTCSSFQRIDSLERLWEASFQLAPTAENEE